jgi:hypothetical protein
MMNRRIKKKHTLLEDIKTWLVVGLVCVVVFALVYAWASYEIGIWHECLQDHSWFYCHRILS